MAAANCRAGRLTGDCSPPSQDRLGTCVRATPRVPPVVLARPILPRQNRRMPTLVLYRFRFRHPATREWVRARHKMQVPELQRHYAEWEIIGTAEVRQITDTSMRSFNPFESLAPTRAIIAPMAPRIPSKHE